MIHRIKDKAPKIDATAFVAWNAEIAGEVTLGPGVGVWFSATLRGDIAPIIIGENTNIQDGVTVHVDHDKGAVLGKGITVGHNAVIHACAIGDDCLIGMGSVILSGARIGARSLVGAGSLVTENSVFPEGSLIIGSPAKAVKQVGAAVLAKIKENALNYAILAQEAKNDYQEISE
jgi:carbonic anhydrase/acetyltransferase-like protein (isoleucine patch superfamily)